MNERLKQLAAKAYLSVNPGPDPYNEAEAAWLGFGPFERKFAELIVKECIDIVDAQWEPVLVEKIREHFGVEE